MKTPSARLASAALGVALLTLAPAALAQRARAAGGDNSCFTPAEASTRGVGFTPAGRFRPSRECTYAALTADPTAPLAWHPLPEESTDVAASLERLLQGSPPGAEVQGLVARRSVRGQPERAAGDQFLLLRLCLREVASSNRHLDRRAVDGQLALSRAATDDCLQAGDEVRAYALPAAATGAPAPVRADAPAASVAAGTRWAVPLGRYALYVGASGSHLGVYVGTLEAHDRPTPLRLAMRAQPALFEPVVYQGRVQLVLRPQLDEDARAEALLAAGTGQLRVRLGDGTVGNLVVVDQGRGALELAPELLATATRRRWIPGAVDAPASLSAQEWSELLQGATAQLPPAYQGATPVELPEALLRTGLLAAPAEPVLAARPRLVVTRAAVGDEAAREERVTLSTAHPEVLRAGDGVRVEWPEGSNPSELMDCAPRGEGALRCEPFGAGSAPVNLSPGLHVLHHRTADGSLATSGVALGALVVLDLERELYFRGRRLSEQLREGELLTEDGDLSRLRWVGAREAVDVLRGASAQEGLEVALRQGTARRAQGSPLGPLVVLASREARCPTARDGQNPRRYVDDEPAFLYVATSAEPGVGDSESLRCLWRVRVRRVPPWTLHRTTGSALWRFGFMPFGGVRLGGAFGPPEAGVLATASLAYIRVMAATSNPWLVGLSGQLSLSGAVGFDGARSFARSILALELGVSYGPARVPSLFWFAGGVGPSVNAYSYFTVVPYVFLGVDLFRLGELLR